MNRNFILKYSILLFLFTCYLFPLKPVTTRMTRSANDENLVLLMEKKLYHANRLVRENHFNAAEEFYETIYFELDTLENDKFNNFAKELDAHYHNFQILKKHFSCLDDNNVFFGLSTNGISFSELKEIETDSIEIITNKRIKKYVKYYTGKARKSLEIFLSRYAKYRKEIDQIFNMHDLDANLALLPVIESGYDPFAHSYAYAAGLWQLVTYTGKRYGLKKDWWIDERKNIYKSTNAAAKHLKYLFNKYNDWNLALAAYNCGEGGVNRRIKRHRTRNFWKLSSLPRQTKNYVPKFLALCEIVSKPEKYNLTIPKYERTLYDTIQLDSCVNLKVIANEAKISFEEIKKLNPELKQWLLPPYAENYSVTIPYEAKFGLRDKLNQVPSSILYGSKLVTLKKKKKLAKLADELLISKQALEDLNSFSFKNMQLNKGDLLFVINPPIEEKWFTDFNNKYLTLYDNEKYFFVGRKRINYRVRSGDSIWKIARKFKVSRSRLKTWNKIGSNNLIKLGQNLVIYY